MSCTVLQIATRVSPAGLASVWLVSGLIFGLAATGTAQERQAVPRPPIVEIADQLLAAYVPSVDDPGKIVHELLETARRYSGQPVAGLLISAAREQSRVAVDPTPLLEALEAFLAADPHPSGADAARLMQLEVLQKVGRFDAAKRVGASLKRARQWLVIGPFRDGVGPYLGVPFAPELRFPRQGSVPSRTGPRSARSVMVEAFRTGIDVTDRRVGHVGCYYALNQVVCESPTKCHLRVTCSGSFEVFVNEAVGAMVDRDARRVPTHVFVPVSLGRGLNHVLIKTASAAGTQLTLRYVDGDGRWPAGLTERPVDQGVGEPSAAGAVPTDLGSPPDGIEALATAARKSGEHRDRLLLAAALAAFASGDPARGADWTSELSRRAPKTPAVRIGLGMALLRSPQLPSELATSRARALIEPLLAEGIKHWTAQRQGVIWQDADGKTEDAVRALRRDVSEGRGGPAHYELLQRYLQKLSFRSALPALRADWRKAHPFDPRPVLADAAWRRSVHDVAGALERLRAVHARLPGHRQAARQLADVLAVLGQVDAGLAIYDRLIATDGTDVSARWSRAYVLCRKDPDAAAQAYLELGRDPRFPHGWSTFLADKLLELGRDDDAERILARRVAQTPADMAATRTRTRLRGKHRDFAEFDVFRRDGDKLIKDYVVGPRDKQASTTVVYYQQIAEQLPDGGEVVETHIIRRINDQGEASYYQNASDSARAREVVRLRTVTPDGRSYVPNRVDRKFNMPRLVNGSFIEQIYRNEYSGTNGGPLMSSRLFLREDDAPLAFSEAIVILPANAVGSFRVRGFAGARTEKQLSGKRVAHVFTQRDIPRMPAEAHAPPFLETSPVIAFGEDGDGGRARSARAAFLRRSRRSPEIEAKAAELTRGLSSDQAKLAAIHAFLHREIADDDYSLSASMTGPEPGRERVRASDTLLRRRGRRLLLAAALLESAGVPCTRALVMSAELAQLERGRPLFFGRESYDQWGLHVEPSDGRPLWLFYDAPRHLPLGSLPAIRFGAPALLLYPGRTVATAIPVGDPDVERLRVGVKVEIDKRGRAILVGAAEIGGFTRHHLAYMAGKVPSMMLKVGIRQALIQLMEGWRPLRTKLVQVGEPEKPIRLEVTMRRKGTAKSSGKELDVAMPTVRLKFVENFGGRAERTMALRLTEAMSGTLEAEVDPGPQWLLLEVPRPVRVRHTLLDYDFTARVEAGKLRLRFAVDVRPGTIPATEFAEWLAICRRLDLLEASSLRFARRRH